MARRRRSFRSRGTQKPLKLPKVQFSEAAKRYFTVLFTVCFVVLGGIILGISVVQEIIPNADKQLHTDTASFSMFLVSFVIAMIGWQGIGVLNVLLWLLGRLITFGLSDSTPPTTRSIPPNAWKMIPYCAAVCGIYGFVIGVANADVKTLMTTFDFAIAGGAWGVFLNILARFRLLPFDENAVEEYEEELR